MATQELLERQWRGFRSAGHWTGRRLDEHAVAARPDLRVSDGTRGATLAELLEVAAMLTPALAGAGVGARTPVFLLVTDPLSDLATLLALARLDAIAFFSPPGTAPAEAARALTRSNAALLIASKNGRERADAVVAHSPGVVRLLIDDRDGTIALDGERPPPPEPPVLATPTRYVTFTSGTTGEPKGIQHCADTLTYAGRWAVAQAKPRDGAVVGLVALAHAAGLAFSLLSALAHDRDLLVLHGKWRPAEALDHIREHDGAWCLATPTHLLDLVRAATESGRPLDRFTFCAGGAPVAPELVDAAEAVGITACRVFGLSECLGHTTTARDDPLDLRRRSEGMPYPGTVDATVDGEAACCGPSLFLGYLGERSLAPRLTDEGLFRTGDRIALDADGRVTVLGRIKDIIIRGGENIDPVEVCAALESAPGVTRAVVVGLEDPRLGERVAAALEVRRPDAFAADDVLRTLQDSGMPRFKWPERWIVTGALPTTPVGKIDRRPVIAWLDEEGGDLDAFVHPHPA